MTDSENFTGPNPPKWRNDTSVAYFKDKLYYLGGYELKTRLWSRRRRVDVRRLNESPCNNLFRF